MEPNDTILTSGRIVAEFEDDASQFLVGEAEFVRTPNAIPVLPPAIPVPPAIEATPAKPS
jgi:hypothetical protein